MSPSRNRPAPSDASVSLAGSPARFAAGLHRVADGVWAWVQPNGGTGEANAGLVVGEDAAVVVDTCWDHRQAARLLSACAPQLGPATITTVVNTHCNGDHWWGNALMPDDAEILTSAASLAAMHREKPKELAALARVFELGRRLPGALGGDLAYLHAQLAPFEFADVELRLPTSTFGGRLDLSVGGRSIELIEVGPAHTEGDLVVHVPDAGVVFAADVLFVGQTPVMWAGSAASWVAALEDVMALGPRVVVPGHGPVVDASELGVHRDYWQWLGDGVAERHRRGLPALEAATDLATEAAADGTPWSTWAAPERTFISVAAEYRALEGRPAAESTREMLGAFTGLLRTRRRLLRASGSRP